MIGASISNELRPSSSSRIPPTNQRKVTLFVITLAEKNNEKGASLEEN